MRAVDPLRTGVLGIQPYPPWVMVVAWLVYLVPMVLIVAWPARRRTPGQPAADTPAPETATAGTPSATTAPTPDLPVKIEGVAPREL